MQPYIFPYIGYLQLINAVDKFIIYDDVNFIVRGWINRNKILVNNKEHMFTIPLQDSSRNKLIKDIEISNDALWKSKLLKTIEQSYKKSPYFYEVFGLISDIISVNENRISKLIYHSIVRINQFLGIKTIIEESSAVYSNPHLKNQNRIIDICRTENAAEYINPIGGTQIYSKDLFEKNNIKLFFLKTKPIRYRQFNNDFIESLSVIDIMMFNSGDKIREYLNEYELV